MTDTGPQPSQTSGPTGTDPRERPSIGALIGSITDLSSRLVRAEIAAFKSEMKTKLTMSGAGVGLFVAAGVLALYGLGFLFWAAVSAIALALPLWLATLIVAVGILALAAVLGLVGKKLLAKGSPAAPTQTIASVKEDIATFKEGLK
ncbi:phage holin family protein [Jonesiaceae bacterium BS-20]|uniref:Phage holin family protein n=1 Tax=Jonesiaceae bacterium BS-20 TaxID=3120821 RepID=A0AAU7DWE2_9MICO